MNKYFKLYLLGWGIFLVLFNVCTFVLPSYAMAGNKFTPSFWVVYGFVMASFLCQLVSTFLFSASKNKDKQFLNLSILITGYTAMFSTLGVGILCMRIPKIPSWVCVVACVIIFGLNAIKMIGAKAGSDIVSDVDEKIKANTIFIKSLTIDAETLIARASTDSAKAFCKKVYEAVRFSDPMSHPALSASESQITLKFEELKNSVLADDNKTIEQLSRELIILLNDRNKKCMMLK